MIDEAALLESQRRYFKVIRDDWPMDRLHAYGEEMVFTYSAWGSALGAEWPARRWFRLLSRDSEAGETVPRTRIRTFNDVRGWSELVRTQTGGYELLPYLLLPCGYWDKWASLKRIHNIGPKIACWILRDVSLLMDRSPTVGRREVSLSTRRSNEWFLSLPDEEQAAFLPIDRWVHRQCVDNGVYTEDDVGGGFEVVQRNGKTHYKASLKLAAWSRERGLDARYVDIFWYAEGSGKV